MMGILLAAMLVAQTLTGLPAYTLPDAEDALILVTQAGRYRLEVGPGCDGFVVAQDVEVFAGSHGVAALATVGGDPICNIFIGERLSDTPCLQTDGVCDVDGQ